MRLYINDALIHHRPEKADVLAAFSKLHGKGNIRLGLRRGAGSVLSVSRVPGAGFIVSLERKDGLFGVILDEESAEHVSTALCEYWSGEHPRIIETDISEPDCPPLDRLAVHS